MCWQIRVSARLITFDGPYKLWLLIFSIIISSSCVVFGEFWGAGNELYKECWHEKLSTTPTQHETHLIRKWKCDYVAAVWYESSWHGTRPIHSIFIPVYAPALLMRFWLRRGKLIQLLSKCQRAWRWDISNTPDNWTESGAVGRAQAELRFKLSNLQWTRKWNS